MTRDCLVQIPSDTGAGYHPYGLAASSSMEAAAMALCRHAREVPDEAVITVIVDGVSPRLWNAREINAAAPTYRHRAGQVKQWMRPREWARILALFASAGISPIDRQLESRPDSLS